MPNATYEEGTELVLDSEAIAVGATWSEAANSSDVFRIGPRVSVTLRTTPKVREAWKKQVYKKGELATEGGLVYEATIAETDENKPSTKPLQWKSLGTEAANKVICTLPVEYRPAAVVKDASTPTVEVKENGEVVALDALTAGTLKVYSLAFRAAA